MSSALFETTRNPAWILCRNLDEFPVPDDAQLQLWAEQGRVRPDDYLFNPRLDTCVQAKEVAELKAVFDKATVQRFEKLSWLLALGGAAKRAFGKGESQ